MSATVEFVTKNKDRLLSGVSLGSRPATLYSYDTDVSLPADHGLFLTSSQLRASNRYDE